MIKNTKIQKLHLSGPYSGQYLTEKQQDCLHMLMLGESAKSAARKLDISPRTFEMHILSIRNKLNITTKTDLLNLRMLPEVSKYFGLDG